MSIRPLIVLAAAVSIAGCGDARNPVEGQDAASALARCTGCHGDPANGNAAPPRAVRGATATTDVAVGAHQAHLQPSGIRQPLDCSDCHVKPVNVNDPGHIDGATATLAWGPLASARGVTPTPAAGPAPTGDITCTNYCHGPSASAGGTVHAPSWTKVDGSQAGCGTCHGIPPPPPHPYAASLAACANCHPDTIDTSGNIKIGGGRHINGIVDLAGGGTGCTSCHGDPNRANAAIAAAPPRDTQGNTSSSSPGVGAHQAHLTDGPLAQAFPCASCHTVPTDIAHATQPLDMSFSPLAQTGGATATFDRNALTCANYCHGTAAWGGANVTPKWNGTDQATCGACHGIPPPAPHPVVGSNPTTCANCHPGTITATGAIDVAGGKHVNGNVDVTGGSCTACHGDPNRANAAIAAAPPRGTDGSTDPSSPLVGAHQAHLNAGKYAGAIDCSECHTVPTSTEHATQAIELTFGPKATAYATAASFDPTALTCATFCHGTAAWGGTNHAPVWNQGSTQATCGTCHGIPSSGGSHLIAQHASIIDGCATCHPTYTQNLASHVNGVKDVIVGTAITSWTPSSATTPGTCTASCHSSPTEVRTW